MLRIKLFNLNPKAVVWVGGLFFALMGLSASAQNQVTDRVVKANGDTLNVNVVRTNEESVTFVYPNETTENTLNKSSLREIRYKSGRVENFAAISAEKEAENKAPKENFINKIEKKITEEEPWRKVVFTTVEDDLKGLIDRGEVSIELRSVTGLETAEYNERRAMDKLRIKAHNINATVVLIKEKETETLSPGSAKLTRIVGQAYGPPLKN